MFKKAMTKTDLADIFSLIRRLEQYAGYPSSTLTGSAFQIRSQ